MRVPLFYWSALMRKAGIANYRRHDNRHTYAPHLASSGLSLEIVGRLLGHTTTTTTKRYAHFADYPPRAAADKFGSKIARFSSTHEQTSILTALGIETKTHSGDLADT
jgi:integrase